MKYKEETPVIRDTSMSLVLTWDFMHSGGSFIICGESQLEIVTFYMLFLSFEYLILGQTQYKPSKHVNTLYIF